MWGYMDRGFNENCITRNEIRPGLGMWLDSTCWDIVLDKGYSWWLKGDEWVLMWDTAWLLVFIGLQWVIVPMWWWFGGKCREHGDN